MSIDSYTALGKQAYIVSFYPAGSRVPSDGIDVYVDSRDEALAIAAECVGDAPKTDSTRWIARATVRRCRGLD